MRSPWKVIVNLTTRRKPEKPDKQAEEPVAVPDPGAEEFAKLSEGGNHVGESRIEQRSNEAKAEVEAKPTVFTPPPSEALPIPAVVNDVPDDTEIQQEPEIVDFAPEETIPVVSDAVEPTPVMATKPGKRKRVQTTTKAITVQTRRVPRINQPTKDALSPIGEAKNLDVEINSLRSQLAARLIAQNAQLRTLLDRYDND